MLQTACREDSYNTFKEYSAHLHRTGRAVRLRDLLDFDASGRTPVALDEVEPALDIVRRFNTGAMSLWLHQQGGTRVHGHCHEPPTRPFQLRRGRRGSASRDPASNGDSKNSAIKQVASARFGVTSRYLCSAYRDSD